MPDLFALADLVTPMAIRVAATLRLADHLADGAGTAGELADRTGVAEDGLSRLLAHLAAVGVLSAEAGGRYALTALGDGLRSGGGMRDWLDMRGAVGRADLSLVRLLDTVSSGEPGYPRHFGNGFWEDLSSDPGLSASFDALMAGQLGETAPGVAGGYDWGALGHLTDLGGGTGTMLAAILAAHPELTGTLLDLPGPAGAAGGVFQAAGVAERVTIATGSFFDVLPRGGSYMLSVVLHDWDDGHAVRILRRCAEALEPGARVLVVEGLRGTGADSPMATAMDLRMLVYFGGRERTLEDFRELGAAAGLELIAHHAVPGTRAILEFGAALD